MKICWDMLEGIHLSRNGVFIKGYNSYVYKDKCIECGNPYLTLKHRQSGFCDRSCSLKRREFSLETRKRMSEARKKRGPISEETRQKMSKAPASNPNWKGGVVKKKLPLFDTYACQIDYVQDVRPVIKNGVKLLEVRCKNCNKWFVPKLKNVQGRIGSLVGWSRGENNFYCSEKCKSNCGVFKQVKWPKNHKPRKVNKLTWYTDAELRIWREEVLKRENYICEYCGEKATIAHHNKPKKLEPFFALDPDHGTACCEKCHYKYGHRDKECTTGYLAHVDCK